MPLLNPFKSGGVGVDAELTVGDKEEKIETNLGTESSQWDQTAETIINQTGMDPWLLFALIVIIAWAVPGPIACLRGAGLAIRAFWHALRGKR